MSPLVTALPQRSPLNAWHAAAEDVEGGRALPSTTICGGAWNSVS